MEEELKIRSRLRGKATRLCNDLREYRTSSIADQDDLAYKIHVLEKVRMELKEVQTMLDKVELFDDSNHDDMMSEELFKASRLLSRLESASDNPSLPDRSFADQQFDLRSSLVVKLPTFEGDVLKWAEFWELFKVSVHSNKRYADVQKFVLLKSLLGNMPKQVIEGIPVSEEGYRAAVDVLTRRYARDDVRRDMLLKQLLELPGVSKHDDLNALHRLIDQLTARVRGLEALGVTSDSFSSILLPVVKEKLPEAWRLEWARVQPASADFGSFLDFLQREMEVREQAASGPTRTVADTPRPSGYPAVSGLAASRVMAPARAQGVRATRSAARAADWLCVACGRARHGLATCHAYRAQDVDTRWEIVRAAGVCYRCLGPHYARDCRSSDCPRCGGPHHSSLHGFSTAEPPLRPPAQFGSRAEPSQGTDGRLRLPPADHRDGHQSAHPAPPPPAGQQSQHKGWSTTGSRQIAASAQRGNDSFLPETVPEDTCHSSAPTNVMLTASATQSPADADVMTDAVCPPHDQHTLTATDLPSASVGVCFTQTALVEATGPRGTCMLRVLIDGGSDSSYIRASAADLLGLPTVGSGTFACMGFQERGEEPRVYEKVRLGMRCRHGGEQYMFDLWKTDRLCPQPTPARPPAVTFEPHLLLADDYQGGPVDVLIGVDQMFTVLMWNQVRLTDRLRAVETAFGYVLHGRDDAPAASPTAKYALRCSRLQVDCDRLWSMEALGIAEDEERNEPPGPTWSSKENRYEMGLLWASDERPITNLSSAAARTERMEQRLSPAQHREYDQHLAGLHRVGVIEAPPDDDLRGFYLPHRGIWRNGKLRVVYDGSARDAAGRSLNEYLYAGENLLRRLPAVLLNFRRDVVAAQADIRSAFHQVSVAEEDRKYIQFVWAGQRLRFRRVPFGLTCSPYMLLQTITTHLSEYRVSDPLLSRKLEAGLYMDDVCISFSCRDEADSSMKRTEEIFSDAGMEVHKLRISGDEAGAAVPVLGLRWCTSSDRLAVRVPSLPVITTKRQLLSVLCKPYDPLGVLSPWLVTGRVLFQKTWTKQHLGSDEELTSDLRKELTAWCKGAIDLDVWFPRTVQISADVTYHVFCDASKLAYCCAIYVACKDDVRLLIAKSRLAPAAPVLSVPRLELMAALIGCRLMDFVKRALDLTDPRVVYWTDAMDVLFWLDQRRVMKVFVQNRVTSILQLTSRDQWRHVRGQDNPADLGTRGLSLSELAVCDVWWREPDFLRAAPAGPPPALPAADADLQPSSEAAVELKRERVQTKVSLLASQGEENVPFDVTACSRLSEAVDRLAWVRRFVSNCRLPARERLTGLLTPEERKWSLNYWIRAAQHRTYQREIQAVRDDQVLPPGSPLAKLHPQLDDDGVLEATLRTGERPVPILPDLCHITTLVVDEAHRRCFHQGTRVTLAVLTAEYAVRRLTVRRAVDSCRRCRRYRGLPYRSPEGSLPSFRTQPSRPFAKVGVDYFGPLFVDNSATKVWALLVTCATSRAVHLELVRSQTSAELVLALRRFFALRGTPTIVYSDNARTFHALLSQLPRCVSWRFIPEAAPWWGGFWERLVGVTKKALRITLHMCHLTFDELSATLYELAFFINLRPLTQSDGEDLLTPAHLLFGVTSIDGVLCPTLNECSVSRAWRHRKRVCDHLIRRWCDEYRNALRCWSVSPRGRPNRAPRVGDVVLVHGEGPRGRWPVARVTRLLTGPDGHVRAAFINIRGRSTRRPISRLFLLEAAD